MERMNFLDDTQVKRIPGKKWEVHSGSMDLHPTFFFELVQRFRCNKIKCGHEWNSPVEYGSILTLEMDATHDISLDMIEIAKRKSFHVVFPALENSLEYEFRWEESKSRKRCEECDGRDVSCQKYFHDLPEVLFIQQRRVTFERNKIQRIYGEQTFPSLLDMTKFTLVIPNSQRFDFFILVCIYYLIYLTFPNYLVNESI